MQKIAISCTIAQLCRARPISSPLRHVSTIRKKLLKQQYLLHVRNMVNFGPLADEIVSLVWGTPANFASWQRYCTALQYWASAKLCGDEQRQPPIFGRAAITLGIGPHFYFFCFWFVGCGRLSWLAVSFWPYINIADRHAVSCRKALVAPRRDGVDGCSEAR